MRLDERQVASFARIHQPGGALAANERLLRYRLRDSALRIGAESFFFQEGQADLYAEAGFGELRVAPDGEAILVGLRDANLERLGPK